MPFAVFSYTDCSDLLKERFVIELFPNVSGTGELHALSIPSHAVGIKNSEIHLREHEHILSLNRSVAHHSLVFLVSAFVVAFAVTAIGVQRIAVDVNRAVAAVGTWDVDDDDMLTVGLNGIHVFLS